MRIDLGLVLAIVIEYIVFIYYADTLFYRKKGKTFTYLFIALMSVTNMVSCMIGNVIFNVITQVAGHIISLLLCYYVSVKTAFFQSFMLMIFMFADEVFTISMPFLGMENNPNTYLPEQSLMLTVISRFLYVVEIMIVSRLFLKKSKTDSGFSIPLILIPILSTLALWLMVFEEGAFFWVLNVIMILINMIVFTTDQKLFRKEAEAGALKEEIAKDKINFEEYNMLSEKYEQTRIFRHDMKEHMSVLGVLIDENPEKAKKYIEDILKKEDEIAFSKFSDNTILNILLSKKKGECGENNVEFNIDPINAKLDFISDMDLVTLFSNLLNNALESSRESDEKKIFLNVRQINESFVVIKINNSSDKKPVVINSKLKTTKENDKLHGIGMSSIKKVVKKYEGVLNWSYDEKNKMFNTTVVLKRH